MNQSLCTLGQAPAIGARPLGQAVWAALVIPTAWSGCRLPSSAISAIGRPTTEGTCMRRPALTNRSSTLPLKWGVVVVHVVVQVVNPGVIAEPPGLVRSNDCPLIR